jgi:uncharacterized RDD family membrane protein YckC
MASCTNHPEVTQAVLRCTRCGRPFCPSCVIRLRGFVYCANCKGEQVRDIQSGTVRGELELATLGRRFGAMWIDSFLYIFVAIAGALVLVPVVMATSARLGSSGPAPALIYALWAALIAAIVAYEGLMLQARGQTLGKMAVGIKVVTPEGGDISGGQAWGRAVLRQVFFSYLALVDCLPAAFTKQRTCLHDMIAKTRVVRVRK